MIRELPVQPTPRPPAHPVRTAVRFPMKLALEIQMGHRTLQGTTINISANGLLFTGPELPELNAQIEFSITMPAAVMGASEDVLIRCLGRVIRLQEPEGQKQAAVIIDEYFLRA